MTAAGIVAEFNPLHLGHEYLLHSVRKQIKEDAAIICVMSGDYVQRGEPALFSKFCRAEAAVAAGADLVLELPLPWSISSAERFATGAISVLHQIGVSKLFFGSECGDADRLRTIAELLLSEDVNQKIMLLLHEEKNISYAAAREKVLYSILGESDVLRHSNDILGVEYIKAVLKLQSGITPVAIRRIGAGHNSQEISEILSASAIRKRMQSDQAIDGFLPNGAMKIYQSEIENRFHPVFPEDFDALLMARLRFLDENDFEQIDDAGFGLGRAIFRAIHDFSEMDEVYQLSSKRYTASRIRRICLKAALGCPAKMEQEFPPYARILAANRKGCAFLAEKRELAESYLISKPASVRKLSEEAQRVFALNADAHDFYVLAYQDKKHRLGGQDWKHSPIIL